MRQERHPVPIGYLKPELENTRLHIAAWSEARDALTAKLGTSPNWQADVVLLRHTGALVSALGKIIEREVRLQTELGEALAPQAQALTEELAIKNRMLDVFRADPLYPPQALENRQLELRVIEQKLESGDMQIGLAHLSSRSTDSHVAPGRKAHEETAPTSGYSEIIRPEEAEYTIVVDKENKLLLFGEEEVKLTDIPWAVFLAYAEHARHIVPDTVILDAVKTSGSINKNPFSHRAVLQLKTDRARAKVKNTPPNILPPALFARDEYGNGYALNANITFLTPEELTPSQIFPTEEPPEMGLATYGPLPATKEAEGTVNATEPTTETNGRVPKLVIDKIPVVTTPSLPQEILDKAHSRLAAAVPEKHVRQLLTLNKGAAKEAYQQIHDLGLVVAEFFYGIRPVPTEQDFLDAAERPSNVQIRLAAEAVRALIATNFIPNRERRGVGKGRLKEAGVNKLLAEKINNIAMAIGHRAEEDKEEAIGYERLALAINSLSEIERLLVYGTLGVNLKRKMSYPDQDICSEEQFAVYLRDVVQRVIGYDDFDDDEKPKGKFSFQRDEMIDNVGRLVTTCSERSGSNFDVEKVFERMVTYQNAPLILQRLIEAADKADSLDTLASLLMEYDETRELGRRCITDLERGTVKEEPTWMRRDELKW